MEKAERLNNISEVRTESVPETAMEAESTSLSAESLETLEAIAINPETSWESVSVALDAADTRVAQEKDARLKILDREISDARQLQEVRSSLGLPASDEKLAGVKKAIEATDKVIDNEDHLTQLEQVVTDAHAAVPAEALEVSRSKEARTKRLLSEVCARNNQFILHGIRVDTQKSGMHPDENSMIQGDASFGDRLKILRALKPEISCSSFRSGEAYEGGWSSVGVLLSGGEIVHAELSDAGTKAAKDGTRQVIGERRNAPEEIDKVLSKNDNNGYNELVVRNPMIAGLYVNFDKLRDDLEREVNSEWQSKQVVASIRSKRNGTSDREELNKIADDPEYKRALTQEEISAIDTLNMQLREKTRSDAIKRALENWKRIKESSGSDLPQFMIVDGIPKQIADWDEQGPVFTADLEGGISPQTLDKYADPLSVDDRKNILASIPDSIFKGGKGSIEAID